MSNVFYAGQNDYIAQLNSLWDRATISVIGTSTSSLTVSVGSKTFTTNTNLQFAVGSQVTITATGDLSKYMSGQVTAYNQTTGAITVNVTSVNSTGTFTSWSITLSGAAGATGAAGADGIADNISIGTVTSGTAAASITGTSPNKFLNLTLQTGATGATGAAGAPNVLSIGSVTSSGTASATITGTSPSQVLNLVLPKGDTGATGAKGVNPRGAWSAGTAYAVDDLAYSGGSTWRRKIAGTTATIPSSDATNWEIFAQKGTDGVGSVAGVTASAPLGSTGGTNPNITITQATTSTDGYLSSANWNTFNNKQAALGFTPANRAGDTFTGNVAVSRADATTSFSVINTSSTAARYPSQEVRNFTGGFGGYPVIELINARGTSISPVSISSGDILGGFNTWGYNGTADASATRIEGVAEATFSTDVKAGLSFKTVTGGVQTQKMYLTGGGKLLLGTNDNGIDLLQVGGTASVVANSATPALMVTQTGAGHALLVQDEAADTTSFVVGATGNVGIGGASFSDTKFRITGLLPATGTASVGTYLDATIPATNTGAFSAFTTIPSTENSGTPYTVGSARHFTANGVIIGTNGTVTTQYGFLVESGLTTATTNYGFFGNIPTGANRWNLYMAGTAKNHMAGNLLLGSVTDTGEKLQVTGNAKVAGTITATNVVTNGYTAGYLEIPQNAQSAAYTLVLSDAGKHIYHPSADTTARTFTIPANASVAYPIGTAITFVNDNAAGVLSIAITTDTMRLAGAGTTGTRTLAANGVATAIKLTATSWIISGTGLT